MLIRITLIVAIVAALAVGALNFFVVKEKITALTTDRDSERGQKVEAQTELASTKKDLSKTKADLAQTQTDLNNTKTERDQAVATAAKQTQRADDLSDKLAKTSQERDAAQHDLAAYQATGFDADQVGKLARSLKDAQGTCRGRRQGLCARSEARGRRYGCSIPAQLSFAEAVTSHFRPTVILNDR